MARRESSLLAEKRKRGVLLPVCMICEETPPKGIAGGMLVSGRFLCARCERDIVHAQVGDSRYTQLKEKIKQFWAWIQI